MKIMLPPSLLKIYGALVAFFVVLGGWLAIDLQQGYEKVLTNTAERAMQRSQIINQSFRIQILAADYVLRDLLGRIQVSDLVYPDGDPAHAQRMTDLLKEKADTLPDFFSMVFFNQDCVFTATASGKNTGIRSKPELCEARKRHTSPGPLASYVPGTKTASGRSALVLSRHIRSPAGDFQGGVLGVIELTRAQQWFDALRLEAGDSIALLDNEQILLARRPLVPETLEKRVTTFEIPSVLLHAATALEASVVPQKDLDGSEHLMGFSKIEGFPFIVAYGIDKAEATQEWQQRAIELTVGYCILLLLATLIAHSHLTTLRQRDALRASEEHFRMLAENMADIVWRVDAQMHFTYVNAADQRTRGFSPQEIIGTHVRDNLTPQGQGMLEDMFREGREIEASNLRGIPLKYELPMRHKDAGEIWIEMSSVPIYASDGTINGYQGIGRDVSDRRQHEKDLLQSHQKLENQLTEVVEEKSVLQEMVIRDGLTRLYNRRYLDTTLPRELAHAERDGKPLAIIMLDLDHFKKINDQYGHAAGDVVLVALAELLKKGARDSDFICRYGGEEFVAIMPNMSVDQALERVESWRMRLERMRVAAGDVQISVTLSAGIAVFPEHGRTANVLLTRADEMLYQSKSAGRNRISVYAQK